MVSQKTKKKPTSKGKKNAKKLARKIKTTTPKPTPKVKEETPMETVTEVKEKPKETVVVAPTTPKEKQYNLTLKHLLVFMELEDTDINREDIASRLNTLKEWKKDNRKKTEWTQARRDAQSARMQEHYKNNESKMKGRKITDEHREKLRVAQQARQEKLREQKAQLAEFETKRAEFEAWQSANAS